MPRRTRRVADVIPASAGLNLARSLSIRAGAFPMTAKEIDGQGRTATGSVDLISGWLTAKSKGKE
jgi:hypothetical protein